MTLAETASIFCETICREGALREAEGSPTEQLEILEGSLQEAAGVVVDILSRFLFESRLSRPGGSASCRSRSSAT